MSDERVLTSGEPVPEDGSHREIDPKTGMQRDYVILSAEERAKGFVKPVRYVYTHNTCGDSTKVSTALAETYARNPGFYSGTFCVHCRAHFPLVEFEWEDGEPMDPKLQPAWNEQKVAAQEAWRQKRIQELNAELTRLRAQGGDHAPDRERGIYHKFDVTRTDGTSEPGKKHDGCFYFVLDLDHDPHARPAIQAYAISCRADYPRLADDLSNLLVDRDFGTPRSE